MGATKKGIMAGRKGFCAEHKPGFPDAYDERMLNHEQRNSELLRMENRRLRAEIARLNRKYTEAYLAVKKVFESAP